MSTMNIAKPKRRTVWDFIKQQPLGFIGLILILIMSIAAIFSPEVAPYHPEDVDFEASPALGGGQPSWGLMLSGVNSDYYRTAAWMIIYPGLAVSIAVFSFNLFGDSLRDWLDPKLKL